VRTLDDVFTWQQTLSQGLLIEADHPTGGRIKLPGPPLRFDDQATAGGRDEHLPPPRLGQHDESVRAWLDEMDAKEGS
jgi:crotonobetainyl-CoA:carnitine CoA-transferase CaiB-like acyl-CoA transferase